MGEVVLPFYLLFLQDNLFGATAAKKPTPSLPVQSEEKAEPPAPSTKKAPALLFSSDEEVGYHCLFLLWRRRSLGGN